MRLRRLTTLFLALLLALGLAAARPERARADGDQKDTNAAIAINTKDGSSIFKLAFEIRRVAGDVVDQTNEAVAYASCSDCQTVAIAIQIVLVFSEPSVVTPTNVAVAVNYECTSCETLASAYQFVISTGGPVRFTPEGRKEIAEIRKELEALGHSHLSILEIQARVKELIDRLKRVLATQLVPIGKGKEHGGENPRPPPPPPPATTTESTTTQPTTIETTTTEPTTTETTGTTTTTPTNP